MPHYGRQYTYELPEKVLENDSKQIFPRSHRSNDIVTAVMAGILGTGTMPVELRINCKRNRNCHKPQT